MKTIISDGFLLKGKSAEKLYHSFAERMPIIDYHCHLDPRQIALDHKFGDVGELMLGGDHYKWRAMRSHGIREDLITGDAPWREKFRAFASVIPYCIGNPLYHWTHLELKRYFGINEILNPESADRIFDECSARLSSDGYSARGLIAKSNVRVLCTTDDPADSLEYHKAIRDSGFSVKVLPAFRPDKAVNISKDTFLPYIAATGIDSYDALLGWLSARLDHFSEYGCRLSDHGLDRIPFRRGDASAVFGKAISGAELTDDETEIYMTELLLFLGAEYSKRGWKMQLHFGTMRNNNSAAYASLGPDTGFDAMRGGDNAYNISRFLDTLSLTGDLPGTVLYSLNPNDLYILGALIGCFQEGGYRSKIQLGSAWWFNDQLDGMEAQLRALANLGVLGDFIGMLTDSRSFISYTRHEYFRRILCGLIGGWVDDGLYPDDEEALREIIEGISYRNAERYFGF